MEENERYLEALKESLVDQDQNQHLDDHIKNIMDNLKDAGERFTKAVDKERETADVGKETKSLETSGPSVVVEYLARTLVRPQNVLNFPSKLSMFKKIVFKHRFLNIMFKS